MSGGDLRKERNAFAGKVFLYSQAVAVPAAVIAYAVLGSRGMAAFFLAQLVVSLDIVILVLISGAIFDSGDPGFLKLSSLLLFKLLLLIFGLYGILTIFYKEPLALFAGLTLPIGVSVCLGAVLARSG